MRSTNRPQSKRFGRLSGVEFQQILADFRTARTSAQALRSKATREGRKVASLLDDHGATWWIFYELPFPQHLAILIVLLGWKDQILEISKQENPSSAFLEFARNHRDDEPDPDTLSEETLAVFLNLIMGVLYSMESMGYYSLSMHELLQKASKGDRRSLLNAASIDRGVLSTPTAAHIISLAQLRGEKTFFISLFKRMKSPHAARRQYVDLRFMHRILSEVGALAESTPDQLLDLVSDKLRLYSTKSGDPVKGLRELFRTWSREATS